MISLESIEKIFFDFHPGQIVLYLTGMALFLLFLLGYKKNYLIVLIQGTSLFTASLLFILDLDINASTDKMNLHCEILILVTAIFSTISFALNRFKTKFFSPKLSSCFFISIFSLLQTLRCKDFLSLFLTIDLFSICIYQIIWNLEKTRKSHEAAIKFFILHMTASFIFLFSVAIIYRNLGTIDFEKILKINNYNKQFFLLNTSFILMISSLSLRIGLFPFHTWKPDIFEALPSSIAFFISTNCQIIFFMTLFKLNQIYLNFDFLQSASIFSILSYLSIILGTLLAINQTSIKRFLAYLSISHAGCVCTLFTVSHLNSNGFKEGLLNYFVSYCFFSWLNTLTISKLEKNKSETLQICDLKGLWKIDPLLSIALLVGLVNYLCIPLTFGFLAKFINIHLLLSNYRYDLIVLIGLSNIVSFYFIFKIFGQIFFNFNNTEINTFLIKKNSIHYKIILVLTIISSILLGIFRA